MPHRPSSPGLTVFAAEIQYACWPSHGTPELLSPYYCERSPLGGARPTGTGLRNTPFLPLFKRHSRATSSTTEPLDRELLHTSMGGFRHLLLPTLLAGRIFPNAFFPNALLFERQATEKTELQ